MTVQNHSDGHYPQLLPCSKKAELICAILSKDAFVLGGLIRSGVGYFSVCMERLKKLGYTSELTTIKRYIAAHR